MNKKGFTLIEMIAVVVIIGIVLAISLPNLSKIIGKQSDTEYNAQLKLVKNALDLYTIRHHGVLSSVNNSCILVDYSDLKDEELIIEGNISCNGKIVMTPKKGNSYSYQYFLNCTDDKGKVKSSYRTSDLPSGCYDMNS